MNILDQLAEYASFRVEEAKKKISLEEIKAKAYSLPKGDFEFEKALKKDGVSFICECKKASPSKGIIAEEFDYLNIAKEYEKAGADCISVLTEPKWFLGSDEYLRDIVNTVNIPCIRKDFTVDEYMIYEAKVLGAKAVLLICSILSEKQISDEIPMAINAKARIIGVNNRNLKDFSVDTNNSARLRKLIPADTIFVSESGIKNADDIKALSEAKVDAVLIGETLMKAEDKKAKLTELRGI